ncbi:MAG TPA: hypothetical protein VGB56_02215 [Flavisolibacter sp.]
MQEYIINVAQIEDLQTISNTDELERIFERAKSTIVNGERVVLVRRHANGREDRFDELTTEEDLGRYRESVFKYL